MRATNISNVLVALAIAACGETRVPCTLDFEARDFTTIEYNRCGVARLFAARDASELTPTDDDTDRYYRYINRVGDYSSVMGSPAPQAYRAFGFGVAIITTTNPAISSAIGATMPSRFNQLVPTGDQAFDEAMALLVDARLYYSDGVYPDGTFKFDVEALPFNEEHLAERLLATSSHLPDPEVKPWPDAHWRWLDAEGTGSDDATAEIRSTIGWGDCIVACDGFHDFMAIVPPENTGEIEVYDLGGDPLPDYVHVGPEVKPAPP